MDFFTRLPQRTKILIVVSALFLVTLSFGLIVFGSNVITHENTFLDAAKNSTQADMLYIHPTEPTH